MRAALAVPMVLTVEDDPIVRADLRIVLEDAGFAVTDAEDGVQAVELAREREPDAIVLDLSLPRLDGVEATRRILAERDVPIIALTGRSRDLAEEAVDAGATAYVLKPFHAEEVVGAVLDGLAVRREARAARALEAARSESRLALADLVTLLGYPQEWAADLEERAFRAGSLWRRVR